MTIHGHIIHRIRSPTELQVGNLRGLKTSSVLIGRQRSRGRVQCTGATDLRALERMNDYRAHEKAQYIELRTQHWAVAMKSIKNESTICIDYT